MAGFKRPPFRSLRDLVLKELASNQSTLVWNGDRTFADDLLPDISDSEAYILDRSAQEYLAGLSDDLTQEDYFRSIAHLRLPFRSVWIESVFDGDNDHTHPDQKYEVSNGALIRQHEDGTEVMQVTVVHGEKPWRPLYSGTLVLFARDGEVICTKTPISKLYDRMAEADGFSPDALLHGDIDKAVRMAGLFSVMTAVLDRPRVLDREPPHALRKSEVKAYERAGRTAPRQEPSIIRLSSGFQVEREGPPPGGEKTGIARAAHWVRGHLFLARNGKLTWRRAHVRGEGVPASRVHHVTE